MLDKGKKDMLPSCIYYILMECHIFGRDIKFILLQWTKYLLLTPFHSLNPLLILLLIFYTC